MLDANLLFAPTRPLASPGDESLFIGRTQQFAAAERVLELRGTSLVIHGPRGIGKTSFARQLMARLCREDAAPSRRLLSVYMDGLHGGSVERKPVGAAAPSPGEE